MDNTLSQGYALLLFLYAGVCLGLVYSGLRIMRTLAASRFLRHGADGLFAAVFFLVSGAAFKLVTGGALRLYGFLLMCGGFALQQWAFGNRICKMIVKRRRALRKKG